MMLNVAAPLLVQLGGEDLCELTELGSDDTTDEEGKIEFAKEKESFTYSCHLLSPTEEISLAVRKNALNTESTRMISERWTQLPELPPEV
jgi:hypothetical protein